MISPAEVSSVELLRTSEDETSFTIIAPAPVSALHRGCAIELDRAAAGLSFHAPVRRCQPDAARARLDLNRPADVAQLNTAATRRCFHAARCTFPAGCCLRRSPAPRLAGRIPTARFPPPVSALMLPFTACNLDVSSAGLKIRIAADGADFNRAAAGFCPQLRRRCRRRESSRHQFQSPRARPARLHSRYRRQSQLWRTPFAAEH